MSKSNIAANKLLKAELLPIMIISLVLALRQIAMIIVLPFLSVYCRSLNGYTPFLAGLSLGIFGLTQAIFQIPFGILSDHWGNKKPMLIGLSMVVAGLVLAFLANNIYLFVLARTLQGSGAIVGVGYSWVSGIVSRSKRTRAFSIVGAFLSVSAALAYVIGPLLREITTVSIMFLACAILLFIDEIYILFFVKDTGSNEKMPKVPSCSLLRDLLKNRTFVRINIAAFFNNFMMMAVFFAVPMCLDKITGENGLWKVFVPSVAVALVAMKIATKFFEKGYHKVVMIVSFLISSFSISLYFFNGSFLCFLIGTSLFLSGYISLATVLATAANNAVQDDFHGAANGVFNSFQYIGNFAGPIVVGAIWSFSNLLSWGVMIMAGLLGLIAIAVGGLAGRDHVQTPGDIVEKVPEQIEN